MSTPYGVEQKKAAGPRLTVPKVRAMKGAKPIVSLTAYTAPIAQLVDAEADVIIIGDSMAMVLYGEPNTLGISLFTMMTHASAVVKATAHALCVFDMPFGSYQESPEQAFRNAARVMKRTGVQAIKIEGGVEMGATAKHLVDNGIPVMAHVGLRPQALHSMGGFRVQGKGSQAAQVLADAAAMDQAGVFATIVEGVPEGVGAEITKQVSNPTIGIGAGVKCDGQVLVTEDMLGLTGRRPKFVKAYANLAEAAAKAIRDYAGDVRAGRFPTSEYTYADAKK
jgi:3-methyl-2-oxobutanoate hydroxymethyltransferase